MNTYRKSLNDKDIEEIVYYDSTMFIIVVMEKVYQLRSDVVLNYIFNWDSVHARLNSHKAWNYKKKIFHKLILLFFLFLISDLILFLLLLEFFLINWVSEGLK